MDAVNGIISAVEDCGIPCVHEFSDYRVDVLTKPMCAFVGVKRYSLKDAETVPEVQVRITLQGGENRVDGALLTETAENVIVPAVLGKCENISKTEISEVKLNTKTGMLCCEIIFTFAAPETEEGEETPDLTEFAEFGGVKIYAPEYEVSRAALTAETNLISGGTVLHFGGGGVLKIKMKGFADSGAAVKLDALLRGGGKFSLGFMGAVFGDVMLSKYSCESGAELDKAELEFIGVSAVSAAAAGEVV